MPPHPRLSAAPLALAVGRRRRIQAHLSPHSVEQRHIAAPETADGTQAALVPGRIGAPLPPVFVRTPEPDPPEKQKAARVSSRRSPRGKYYESYRSLRLP